MDAHEREAAAAGAAMQDVYGQVIRAGVRVYVEPQEAGMTLPAVVVAVHDAVWLTVQFDYDGTYRRISRLDLAPF